MNTLVRVLPFWGVLLFLVPLLLMQNKKMVDLNKLLIFVLPDKNMFIWMFKFSYYMLIITMITLIRK